MCMHVICAFYTLAMKILKVIVRGILQTLVNVKQNLEVETILSKPFDHLCQIQYYSECEDLLSHCFLGLYSLAQNRYIVLTKWHVSCCMLSFLGISDTILVAAPLSSDYYA